MATVTIQIPPATEQTLREQASRDGKSLESYLLDLLQEAALATNGTALGAEGPQPSAAEFDRGLDEFSAGLPPLPSLPADLSRADLHGEHD